jgi:hypothetical protein
MRRNVSQSFYQQYLLGSIPSQLSLLGELRKLMLDGNHLSGLNQTLISLLLVYYFRFQVAFHQSCGSSST